ncbi:MAG TPA: hypothetical protein PKY81_05110 [bacterium]|nr:hypothetical protein [bacterium]HPN30316.1 hypothetical protein [bacterium]
MKKKHSKISGFFNAHLFGSSSLFKAEDHLLYVEKYSYTENYKRFYYSDIQLVYMVPSLNFIYTSLIYLTIGIIFFLLLKNIPFGWTFPAFFFTLSIISFFVCGNSKFYIKTAAQKTRIKCVKRKKSILRILNIIRPLILESQKNIKISNLNETFEKPLSNTGIIDSSTVADNNDYKTNAEKKAIPKIERALIKNFNASLYLIFLSVLALTGVLSFAYICLPNYGIYLTISITTGLCLGLLLLIFVLINLRKSGVSGGPVVHIFVSLAYIFIEFFFAYILFIIMNIRFPENSTDYFFLISKIFKLNPVKDFFMYPVAAFTGIAAILLAATGLIQLKKIKQRQN